MKNLLTDIELNELSLETNQCIDDFNDRLYRLHLSSTLSVDSIPPKQNLIELSISITRQTQEILDSLKKTIEMTEKVRTILKTNK